MSTLLHALGWRADAAIWGAGIDCLVFSVTGQRAGLMRHALTFVLTLRRPQ